MWPKDGRLKRWNNGVSSMRNRSAWYEHFLNLLRDLRRDLPLLWEEARFRYMSPQREHLWSTKWILRFRGRLLLYGQRYPFLQGAIDFLLLLISIRRFLFFTSSYISRWHLETPWMVTIQNIFLRWHFFLFAAIFIAIALYTVLIHTVAYTHYGLWLVHGLLCVFSLSLMYRRQRMQRTDVIQSMIIFNLGFFYLYVVMLLVLYGPFIFHYYLPWQHCLLLFHHILIVAVIYHLLRQVYKPEMDLHYISVAIFFTNWSSTLVLLLTLFFQNYLLSFVGDITYVEVIFTARLVWGLLSFAFLNMWVVSASRYRKTFEELRADIALESRFVDRYWSFLERRHWIYVGKFNLCLRLWGALTFHFNLIIIMARRLGLELPKELFHFFLGNDLLFLLALLFLLSVLALLLQQGVRRQEAFERRQEAALHYRWRHSRQSLVPVPPSGGEDCYAQLRWLQGAMKLCLHALQGVPWVQSLRPALEDAFDALGPSRDLSSPLIPPCSLQTQAQALFHLQFYLEESLEILETLEFSQGTLEAPLKHLRFTLQQSLHSLSLGAKSEA